MAPLDPDICYRALVARDERFDGRFFVGVTSTGIYCRPVCAATTAGRKNCRFFVSAAGAQEAGFRPCLRCRPETAPQLGAWRGSSNTVTRGLDRIAAGELDGEHANVDALAERLGVGARQLRRLFQQHLGASPIAVAQTRRLLFAKQLIHDTRLPLGEVAFAAGFGSVRRFNETFRRLYDRSPSALRRKTVPPLPEGSVGTAGVTVHLPYRPPYDWLAMLAYFRARAIAGVETVTSDSYARTFSENGAGAADTTKATGTVVVRHLPALHSLAATIRCSDVRALAPIVNRIRRVFDLGADVDSITAHLAHDPLLAPLLTRRPGLRLPGGWNGFEVGIRAILGQQVSVSAARQLVSRLTERCGAPAEPEAFAQSTSAPGSRQTPGPPTAFIFPTAQQVLDADLSKLGVPGARAAALVAVSRAALADPDLFQPKCTVDDTVARLRFIPGVGSWTAQYIALRAAREPDAFPADDAGLQRTAAALMGAPLTTGALLRRAERWRPWRAYAAQHLWAADPAVRHHCQEVIDVARG